MNCHRFPRSLSLRHDLSGLSSGEVINVIVLVILIVVLVVVVTALLPTYNGAMTNYSANSTSGLRAVVGTVARLLLDVAILIVITIGLLAVALRYGHLGHGGHGKALTFLAPVAYAAIQNLDDLIDLCSILG